jgi:lysophospholipase L1-like esterase
MSERARVGLAAAAALALFALAVGILTWTHGADWTVAAAAVCLVPGAILLQVASNRARKRDLVSRKLRRGIPFGIAVAGLGLLGLWWLGTRSGFLTGAWGLGGLCLFYLGIGQLLAEIRSERELAWGRGKKLTVACAVALVVGVVVCLLVWVHGIWLAVLALLAVPAGLTLISEGVLWRRERWIGRAPLAAGVLVGAAALWLHYGLDLGTTLTLGVVGAAWLLLGAIASNTQVDVLLVVTIAGLFWVSTPVRAEDPEPVAPARGEPTLVALGDSYISGEGAQEFLRGTNDAGVNECRRAPTAYPYLAVAARKAEPMERLAFVACSGALTRHILRDAQWRGEPIDGTPEKGVAQHVQLADLLDSRRADPELIVISIGGNDAGFANIATACLAPGSCVERGQLWLDRLETVAGRVFKTYAAIRAQAKDVPILAVPYPVPIADRACSYSQLGADERTFLNRFVLQLDRAVENAAKRAGVHYLDGMVTALERAKLQLCDADEEDVGVNFIRVKSVQGVADQVLAPSTWLHNSFHPNEKGHAAMATALETWIDDHAGPPPNPAPRENLPPYTARRLDSMVSTVPEAYCRGTAEPRYCDRDDAGWALTRLVGAAAEAAPAILLLVAGWLLWWLPVLEKTRPRLGARGDSLTTRLFGP